MCIEGRPNWSFRRNVLSKGRRAYMSTYAISHTQGGVGCTLCRVLAYSIKVPSRSNTNPCAATGAASVILGNRGGSGGERGGQA